jgi:hypothetical protein
MVAKLDGTNGLLQQYDYQAPTTGFSYTFAAGTTVLVMNPAGTLATGTITMPAAPADGMNITFSSTQTITALTVNANTGQTIVSAPTVLPANQTGAYIYRLSNTTWYPYESVPTNVPVTPAGGTAITSGTAVSASGTSVAFTGIPSWVKRITVMLNGVSTSGTSLPQIQLGTGAGPTYTTSGYLGSTSDVATTVGTTQHSSGFLLQAAGSAANVIQGAVTLNNITGNTWVAFGVAARSNTIVTNPISGSIPLAAVLTAVRVTTVNGTDTFDAGTINILYE